MARALRARGYEAHPQVGVQGFWIELGIVDPTKPGTYVLGVECDGASYHSARSARDRDRLRQRAPRGTAGTSTESGRPGSVTLGKQVEAVVNRIALASAQARTDPDGRAATDAFARGEPDGVWRVPEADGLRSEIEVGRRGP